MVLPRILDSHFHIHLHNMHHTSPSVLQCLSLGLSPILSPETHNLTTLASKKRQSEHQVFIGRGVRWTPRDGGRTKDASLEHALQTCHSCCLHCNAVNFVSKSAVLALWPVAGGFQGGSHES